MSISQNFVNDFIKMLEEADVAETKNFRDRVLIGLLLVFTRSNKSNYYKRHLLYRNFYQSQNTVKRQFNSFEIEIPEEAKFYIDDVLWLRRLLLTNNLLDKPGNTHLLLAHLCHLNTDNYWQDAVIKRNKNPEYIDTLLPEFRRIADILKEQEQIACTSYSEVAKRRQQESGDFYLTLAASGVKVASELSLDNIFASCPQPINPDYTKDPEFKRLFSTIVEHLNARYSLLRSCGLEPETWMDKNVSIQQLRELNGLRGLARLTTAWINNKTEAAYREVFPVFQEQLHQSQLINKIAKDQRQQNPAFKNKEHATVYKEVFDLLRKQLRKQHSLLPQSEAMPNWVDRYIVYIADQFGFDYSRVKEIYKQVLFMINEELLENPKVTAKKPVAKFISYEAFAEDEIGIAMLTNNLPAFRDTPDNGYRIKKPENEFEESIKPEYEFELPEDTELEDDILEQTETSDVQFFDEPELKHKPYFATLVEFFPENFSPVMAYFFNYILDQHEWRSVIETDQKFMAKLAKDPEYAGLTGKGLCNKLWREAQKLIERNMSKFIQAVSKSS